MATDQIHKIVFGQYETHAGVYINGVPYNGTTDMRASSTYFSDSRTKVNRADWQQRIAKKLDAANAYSRFMLTDVSVGHATVEVEYFQSPPNQLRKAYKSVGGCLFLPGVPPAYSPDNILKDQALGRLKNRLASDESQFKSLVPLGELRETRDLLKGGLIPQATSIVRTFLELKHGKLKVSEVRKRASDLWLTWSFGIKPLVSDVTNLANSIDKAISRSDNIGHYTGTASKSWNTNYSSTKFNLTSSTGTAKGGISHNLSYRYTAGVRFRLASANSYGLAKHFGLTFGDILPAVWELIPYSWLIDYFTTTGSFFEDTFSSSNGNTIYCTLSTRYKAKSHASVTFVESVSPQILYQRQTSDMATANFVALDRTVLTQLPHRAWRLKTLDEVGRNSVNRLLNLTALLAK